MLIIYLIPAWYSLGGLVVPTAISWLAWRNPRNLWKWRLSEAPPSPQGVSRGRKARCVFYTGASTFLLFMPFLMFPALDRARLMANRVLTEFEAKILVQAASRFARKHNDAYPASLAEITRDQLDQTDSFSASQTPEDRTRLDRTIADEIRFDYYGAGLTSSSPDGIVILASKDAFIDGAHVLFSNDGQEFVVGPTGFPHVQPYLKNHVPVSEWKN
ncbi:MAG: hypothetical protein ABSH22_16875 [Tepidisphaeraceae bacterium]